MQMPEFKLMSNVSNVPIQDLFAIVALNRPLLRHLDRCDRMIQNETRDPNGRNVYYATMQITFLTRKFRNVERNLHCVL